MVGLGDAVDLSNPDDSESSSQPKEEKRRCSWCGHQMSPLPRESEGSEQSGEGGKTIQKCPKYNKMEQNKIKIIG